MELAELGAPNVSSEIRSRGGAQAAQLDPNSGRAESPSWSSSLISRLMEQRRQRPCVTPHE